MQLRTDDEDQVESEENVEIPDSLKDVDIDINNFFEVCALGPIVSLFPFLAWLVFFFAICTSQVIVLFVLLQTTTDEETLDQLAKSSKQLMDEMVSLVRCLRVSFCFIRLISIISYCYDTSLFSFRAKKGRALQTDCRPIASYAVNESGVDFRSPNIKLFFLAELANRLSFL